MPNTKAWTEADFRLNQRKYWC